MIHPMKKNNFGFRVSGFGFKETLKEKDPISLFRSLSIRNPKSAIRNSILGSLLLLLAFLPVLSQAANKNVGTSGAQFLKLGAGPRPTAMGDAFVGLADDINSVNYNPAGLSYISRPEIMAMHTQLFQDLNYEFGAFAYPTNRGAFAFSAATLRTEAIERRAKDESLQGEFDASDSAYALTYAYNLGPLASVGVSGRYIKQEIDTYSADAWSGDIGLLKRFGKYPFSVGLAARHLGQKIKFQNESDPLPRTIDIGLGANLFKERLKLDLDTRFPSDNDIQFGFGSEYTHPFRDHLKLSLRAGYTTTTTDADGSGITFGAGMGLRNFNFDFSWVPFGDLGNTFRYSLHVKF